MNFSDINSKIKFQFIKLKNLILSKLESLKIFFKKI